MSFTFNLKKSHKIVTRKHNIELHIISPKNIIETFSRILFYTVQQTVSQRTKNEQKALITKNEENVCNCRMSENNNHRQNVGKSFPKCSHRSELFFHTCIPVYNSDSDGIFFRFNLLNVFRCLETDSFGARKKRWGILNELRLPFTHRKNRNESPVGTHIKC